MPKDKHPAETYAHEEVGKWLYDKDGYCPFARHKLEGLLQRAHEAGAASVKKTNALTPLQREAVVHVLESSIACGVDHLKDTFGLSVKDAREMMRVIERVKSKLNPKGQENKNV